MSAATPHMSAHAELAPLASRYVDIASLQWTSTRYPGIEIKVLMEDPESGLLTALFRWAPGSRLPYHEHVEIEQTFVLEGSVEDDEGVARAGDFVWRPAGSRHDARAPEGALILAFFLRPNRFFDDGDR